MTEMKPHSQWFVIVLFSLMPALLCGQIDLSVKETVDVPANYVFNEGDVEVVTDVEGNYDVTEEDNVVVLTHSNFNYVVRNRDFVLVEFYAPWCTHCKSLAPEYAAAAKELKKLNLTLGKVDATVEEPLAKANMITGFPTIILYYKGVKQEEFNGDRTAEGLITYMRVRTSPDWKPPPNSVIELTDETFTDFLAKKPLVLVMFYADYCQHCQKMKPEYINAAKTLKEYGIFLAQVEGTKYTTIADEFKVKGYPQLFVFRYGRAFEYKGRREEKGIVEYMREQAKSPSTRCDSILEIENRIERYLPTIMGFFTSDKSKFYDEFMATANYLRNEPLRFVHSFNAKAAKKFGVNVDDEDKREAVIVRKAPIFLSDYEQSYALIANNKITGDDIADFIRANYRPLVGQRTKTNQVYFYSARPLCVVYYDVNFDHQYEKASELIRSKVVEVAKEFPEITFAVANEDEFAPELEAVKLDDSGVDVNVVWYDDKRIKYRMDPVDEFDGSDLRKFVHQALEGVHKPVWKSQPIPKRQEGPVHVLVADNFEEVVFKSPEERDVVYFVHAPWCGHCKEFDKTYKKLAKKMSGKNLLFTKMDGTLNDLPPGFEVKGYPTIFFIRHVKKHEPKLYDGDRSYKDLKTFIDRHSSIFLTKEERDGLNKDEL